MAPMSNRLTHSTRSHHQKASQKSNSWKRNAAFASFAATVRSIKIAMRRGIVIGRRFFSLSPAALVTYNTYCKLQSLRFALYSKCHSLSSRSGFFLLLPPSLCPSLSCSLVRFCVSRQIMCFFRFALSTVLAVKMTQRLMLLTFSADSVYLYAE